MSKKYGWTTVWLAIVLWVLSTIVAGCVNTTQTVERPTNGASSGSSASMASPELGVVVDGKLTIIAFEENSAAEKAGLQLGDNLEKLGDVDLSKDREKARTLIHTTYSVVAIQLIRNGQAMVIEVTPALAQFNSPLPLPGKGESPPRPTSTGVWPPYDYF